MRDRAVASLAANASKLGQPFDPAFESDCLHPLRTVIHEIPLLTANARRGHRAPLRCTRLGPTRVDTFRRLPLDEIFARGASGERALINRFAWT